MLKPASWISSPSRPLVKAVRIAQRYKVKGVVDLPVTSTSTVLLGSVWSRVGMAVLAEEAWKMLLSGGGSVGNANMVTVILLVGTSHCCH